MKGSVRSTSMRGSSRPRWRYRLHLKDEHGGNLWEGKSGFEKQSDADEALRCISRAWKKGLQHQCRQGPSGQFTPGSSTGLRITALRAASQKHLKDTTTRRLPWRHPWEDPSFGPEAHDLETALFGLLKAPGKRRKHLSVRTVRNIAGVLNVALNKAFRLELIPVDPMFRVEQPKYKRKDARSLTPEEMQALRKVCRGDWTFVLIELGLASGARRGELLALTWLDVDWLSRTVTINKSLEQTKAGLRLKGTKNDEMRVCRLPQAAIVALQFLKEQQTEHRRLFGKDYKDQGLVFCKPNGDFLTPDLISQTIIRRLRKAGIKDASLHSCRHSHASNLLSKGIPLSAVSKRWDMPIPTLPPGSMLMPSRPMTIEQQTPGTSLWMGLCSEPALR